MSRLRARRNLEGPIEAALGSGSPHRVVRPCADGMETHGSGRVSHAARGRELHPTNMPFFQVYTHTHERSIHPSAIVTSAIIFPPTRALICLRSAQGDRRPQKNVAVMSHEAARERTMEPCYSHVVRGKIPCGAGLR